MLTNILLIVVEALLFILPKGFERLYRYFIVERHMRRFWSRVARNTLIIAVPPEDVDPEIKGTQVFDFLGLAELEEVLRRLPFTRYRERANRLSQSQKNEGILSVAGPTPNEFTRELLNQRGIRYRFDGNNIIDIRNSAFKLSAAKDEQGRVTRDYGVITLMKNPYSEHRNVVIASGCWGWGTYACLKLLGESKTLKYLLHQGNHFQVICTCAVDADRVPLQAYLLDTHPVSAVRRSTFISLD